MATEEGSSTSVSPSTTPLSEPDPPSPPPDSLPPSPPATPAAYSVYHGTRARPSRAWFKVARATHTAWILFNVCSALLFALCTSGRLPLATVRPPLSAWQQTLDASSASLREPSFMADNISTSDTPAGPVPATRDYTRAMVLCAGWRRSVAWPSPRLVWTHPPLGARGKAGGDDRPTGTLSSARGIVSSLEMAVGSGHVAAVEQRGYAAPQAPIECQEIGSL